MKQIRKKGKGNESYAKIFYHKRQRTEKRKLLVYFTFIFTD
jgi:hypothetical protein